MPTVRMVKALLVATVGLWGLLVGSGNLVDYESNWNFVVHVLAMDSVFPGNVEKSHAITSLAFARVAYWTIIATEFAMGLVCLYGAWRLFRARHDRSAFIAAKAPACTGLLLVWLLYFVGFTTIGGEWFSMWQSQTWNGLQTAFRFLACAMFVMVVVLLPEEAP